MTADLVFVQLTSRSREALARGTVGYRVGGAWAQVEEVLDGRTWREGEAAYGPLVNEVGSIVVHATLQSSSDTIWIRAIEPRRGEMARDLLFVGNRWVTRKGRLPTEDDKAVARFLTRNDLLANLDGYALLDALLGVKEWEEVSGNATLPDNLPACVHGYFESIYPLENGAVLGCNARHAGGWTGTFMICPDGRVVRTHVYGDVVGVFGDNIVAGLHCGEFRPELSLCRIEDDRVEPIRDWRTLAKGTRAHVVGGHLLLIENDRVRRIRPDNGNVGWSRKIAHPIERLEAASDACVRVCGGGEVTTLTLAKGKPATATAAPEQVSPRAPAEGVALDGTTLRWDGGSAELPGKPQLGPRVGDVVFVRTALGLWGDGWWSFRIPVVRGSEETWKDALLRLQSLTKPKLTPGDAPG
ncbi:MAG: hypothetical protein AAGE52_12775 [Myxococcota bacterium]